jgi:signal transduction histidine kinase
MNDVDQKNLFKNFFKTTDPKSRQMNAQGHGLGLAIAKKISNFIGGHLMCQSQLGVGTCFTLEVLSRAELYEDISIES